MGQETGKITNYLHCIAIVDFDIDKGQVIEQIYPPTAILTETERSNLSYMAFPDSNSGCRNETRFHITLRTSFPLTSHQKAYNRECQQHLKADMSHFWGYIYFRQVKDSSIKRGYFQKSFVIITRLPFHNFFYELTQRWAPAYFASGATALEQGWDQVTLWPRLSANIQLTLPILGIIFQIFLPAAANRILSDSSQSFGSEDLTNNNSSSLSTIPISITSPNELDLFGPIHTIIHHIQLMWELVLLGEPIVVIATSPTDSSHMVQALTSLIQPLDYFPEIFPYFTIHNTEFREFSASPKSVIIGVTNPYFAKTLQNWPHTIRISEPLQIHHNSENHVPHKKMERVRSIQKFLMDHTSSIFTQYKPYLQKDKSIVKKVLNGVKNRRPSSVQTIILRRYFLELTQSFMIPLERYMGTLMPLAKDISAFRAPPAPAHFKEDTFLSTLDLSGPHLTSNIKGDFDGLYKRYFRSANFRGWYEARRMEQLEKLEALHQEALAREDLSKWSNGKMEVEIVDMILCIKQKLQIPVTSNSTLLPPEPAIHVSIKRDVRDQLMRQLDHLTQMLPEDLKSLLN